jgi:RNA ligase (TIGR02306 family)
MMHPEEFISSGRPMATIQQISAILPHENADLLEIAIIKGWRSIVQKGQFHEGDKIIFVEIDAHIPVDLAPFLAKSQSVKKFNGSDGFVLKTAKLRGIVSQGLIFPLNILRGKDVVQTIGTDVSSVLGIQKYEAPIPTELMGELAGVFPSWARKTDQDRIQACIDDVFENIKNDRWIIEEKADGTSMSVMKRDDDIQVCGRNMSFKYGPWDNPNNSIVNAARFYNIVERLRVYGRNLSISGELIGPGIQKNIYQLPKTQWVVFDIFDVDTSSYLSIGDRLKVLSELNDISDAPKIPIVPLLIAGHSFKIEGKSKEDLVQEILEMAEDQTLIGSMKAIREGIVFKSIENPDVSFKSIANSKLLKEKD